MIAWKADRRETKEGSLLLVWLTCFQNIGVKATAGNKTVIPLAEGAENKDPEQPESTERNKLMQIAQVTLKRKISDKWYHELTQGNISLLLWHAWQLKFWQIKAYKKSIHVPMINRTPGTYEVAQFTWLGKRLSWSMKYVLTAIQIWILCNRYIGTQLLMMKTKTAEL